MRKVLKGYSEVAHFWANKVQSEGRYSSMFFEGDKIYSYGRHYVIAKHIAPGVVAISTRGYSNTTARHTSEVRQASHHLRQIFVHNVEATPQEIVKQARYSIAESLGKADRARLHKAFHLERAAEEATNVNAYLDAIKSRLARVEVTNLDELKRQIEEERKKEAARAKREATAAQKAREKAEAEARVKAAERLEGWKRGEDEWGSFYLLPCALRIVGDEIETSHGAAIPVEAALRLWPVILRVKGGDKDYEPGMKVGYYTLTQIRRDGSIKVGCHDIAFSEIERMAEQLGLMEPA